ncbi:MAG: tripartite tricarboxylate transporter permease [Candidatus Woesearchaeota archaeon]|jgi:putative membrane protein|nr:tripartite tricarboxylate transporter permease [Candidatus Woesearchaeota archaeon]MDP6265657.1 tripartite tricarboxylate transporter permease [Candidatus Woesearchaeota archaeon]MDP7322698.1 tripartite tricarboxylate transporter permease [Candidatus Woesearchaeota archaeon]MDP7476135.1 tripartite tricarboxylate transporter permease [Candidatus Woesearchaeota archaeon]HJO02028.1 tripartite tricarboxylate transporter permease [Candidatus Woesearchaeota archaeon]|tara:strand:+ start:356 stop:1567 length:1212 start_codon:yes stop_codon:yes gene_type:complete
MFLEFLIAALLGIMAGIFTGLIPGMHINLVSILLVSSSAYLLNFVSLPSLGVFIISMAIAHTFLNVLPAIFLGAPDADTALGVLPGHKLLLKGMGYEAVKLTVIGSLFSLILAVSLIPLLIIIVPKIYQNLQPHIGWILLVVVIYMMLVEKGLDKKFWAFTVFLMAGILGILVLTMPNLKQPLFPMLSGLFGISMLIVSLSNKVEIPKQRITDTIKIPKFENVRALIAATFSGSFVSFFPGLGPAQAAILGSQIMGRLSTYAFLILIGGIDTVNMAVSLVSLYAIDKARNGAVLAIREILTTIDINTLILFLAIILLVGGIVTFLTLYLTKFVIKLIGRVNYSMLALAVIVLITILVFYFSSWLGLLILIVSTGIGIIPNIVNVKRSHSMGCLMLPVILFFVL